MDHYFFDQTRLIAEHYSKDDPGSLSRYQGMVEDFMEGVRRNAFQDRLDIMDEFCGLMKKRVFWELAKNVVPEFRESTSPM